jgi:hypothetical protein
LQIAVTMDESGEEDDFDCPLMVYSDFPPPRADFLAAEPFYTPLHEGSSLMYVHMPTTEDVDDCRMFGVALYSAPPWRNLV